MEHKNENIKIFHDKLLILLAEFDSFCKEIDVDYWIDGGTFIGAVRHKGFIPWDDDLDVCVHLSDMPKILGHIQRFCDTTDNRLLFYYNKNHFHISEYYGDTEYLKDGAFPIRMDISPMKYILNTEKNLQVDKSYTQLLQLYTYGKCKNEDWIIREHYDLYYPVNRNYSQRKALLVKDYYGFINHQKQLIDEQGTSDFQVGYIFEDIHVKKVRDNFDAKMIFPLKTIAFEGIPYPCPNSTDYLQVLYGDFMQLPPVELQVYTQRMLTKSKFKSKQRLEQFVIDMNEMSKFNFALGYKNRKKIKKFFKPIGFFRLFVKYLFSLKFTEMACLFRFGYLQAKSGKM